jgi:hypothetical protein
MVFIFGCELLRIGPNYCEWVRHGCSLGYGVRKSGKTLFATERNSDSGAISSFES